MAASQPLRESLSAYAATMRASPASVPHFALNFPSMAALEPVLERLANGLPKEIADRVDAALDVASSS